MEPCSDRRATRIAVRGYSSPPQVLDSPLPRRAILGSIPKQGTAPSILDRRSAALRLWRAHHLQRPSPQRRKRRRLGDGTAARLRAEHPNHVWALDFQFDETARRRRLKLLNVIDEHTREALAIQIGHSIDADRVVEVVERIAVQRGAPAHLRMDNGPELVVGALRDWCRQAGTHTAYIEPGAPWENGWIESFNGRLRDECLNIEEFEAAYAAARTDQTNQENLNIQPAQNPG